ncbi:hypothetical protein RBSWK_00687 [Rhodopirellula baltica SWK14]|uniref:Uncharacterized protein n=1 Tax=Rhodopirellula baltica SWK14 TaxID=993516 RepID=L7CN69_RHOBT|nr:hypothetical protein RBSWK_00687 [Rhodopirellula baltica SWK14]
MLNNGGCCGCCGDRIPSATHSLKSLCCSGTKWHGFMSVAADDTG